VYIGWIPPIYASLPYQEGYTSLYASLPYQEGTPWAICLPTYTPWVHHPTMLVYPAALVLHGMSAVYREEALGSKRE